MPSASGASGYMGAVIVIVGNDKRRGAYGLDSPPARVLLVRAQQQQDKHQHMAMHRLVFFISSASPSSSSLSAYDTPGRPPFRNVGKGCCRPDSVGDGAAGKRHCIHRYTAAGKLGGWGGGYRSRLLLLLQCCPTMIQSVDVKSNQLAVTANVVLTREW